MGRGKRWIARGLKTLLGAFLLALLVGGAWWIGQPTLPEGGLDLNEEVLASPTYREAADSALTLIQDVAVELGLPSISVAVSVDGEPVWAASLGWADVGARRAAQPGTRYRAGSVSKSMTGLAAARLVQAGKLDLDKPVRDYLPSFPGKRWEVSSRQLSSHTGGIRHYANPGESGFFSEQFSGHHYASVEEALGIFKDDPLLFEPGAGFRYSTHGFTLLSAVMASAAEQPFLDLMSALVWTPFRMSDTRPDDLTQADPNRAVPYTPIGGRLLHLEGPDPSYKWAGGGILTTPADLVRMGGALLTDQVVAPDLRQKLFTPKPLADGSANPQRYALGWRVQEEAELLEASGSLVVMNHGGSSPGGSSFLLLVPDGRVAAAAMTNLSLADPAPIRRAVYRIAGRFRQVGVVLTGTPESPPAEHSKP